MCRTNRSDNKTDEIICNQRLLACSVAASHCSDSIVSPCNWKNSHQIEQTDFFHTDTFVVGTNW